MRKVTSLGLLAALTLCGPAIAAEGISYSNVEVAYINAELDDVDVNGDGFGLSASGEFGEYAFGFINYNDIEYDAGVSGSELSIGLGFHWPLTPTLDLVSGVSYEGFEVDVAGFGTAVDESGYGLSVGLRGRAGERVELSASAKYLDFGDDGDDTKLTAGARYYFSENLAAGVEIADQEGITSWLISLRYDFGPR